MPAAKTEVAATAGAPAGLPGFLERADLSQGAAGQAGLTVSQPHDPSEREASRVASLVLGSSHPVPEPIQAGSAADLARRTEPGGVGPTPAAPPRPPAAALGGATAGGQPLPTTVRTTLEPLFGRDLRDVRVHTDASAGGLSRSIQARAFTRGRDIFFAPGRYDPTSRSGLALLAHELTHVVQGQRPGAADLQAQLEQDFAGRSEVPVPTSGRWPAGYVRVTNAAGTEVLAPARPYPIDQVPTQYDRLSMARESGTISVGELRADRAGSRGRVETTIMVAMYDGRLQMVGYDTYRIFPGGRTHAEAHSGYVAAGPGTGGVGRNLIVERIRQVVQAGIPLMRLDVNPGITPTETFHVELRRAAGLSGPLEPHYVFGPREMAKVLGRWGYTLTLNQRTELLVLASRPEPTVEQIRDILLGRTGGPGGGPGGLPMLPGSSGSTLGRFRSGPVRAAGAGLGLIAVANDLLAPIAATYDVQRQTNRMWEAQIDFWARLGAYPRVAVWDWERRERVQESLTDPSQGVWNWDQEPAGPDAESRIGLGIFESHRSKYVVDIDVEAFKQQLPYFIRDYQDLELFLALGDALGLGDGRAIRKEGNRYLATVNGVDYGRQIVYDITDTIEEVRVRTIRQGDARMQAELRGLPAGQLGQIFRLKSGRNTKLYRAAGESVFRGDQVLVDSERFMGPDPWVRTLGRVWFWNRRVLVAPANGDALRAAQLATYWVGRQDIEETLEEVKDGNRPILSESRVDGRLEGFVAGPDPEGRFGQTRYTRDPKNPRNWTIAVGELKQFWVDADELEHVHLVQALNYAALPPTPTP